MSALRMDQGPAWHGQSFGIRRAFCRMAKLFLVLTASASASDDRTLATFTQSFAVEDARIFNAAERITFETIMASHAANITEVDDASCDLTKQQLTVNPGGPGEGMTFANLVEYTILWSSSEEDVEQKFQNRLNAALTTLTTLLHVGGLNVTKSSEALLLLQIDDPTTSPTPEQLSIPSPSPSVVLAPTMPSTSPTSSSAPSSNKGEIVRGQYLQQFTVNDGDVFDEDEIAYFESTLESYTENISDVATNASCTVLLQRVVQPLPPFQSDDTVIMANQVEYLMEWKTSDEDIASKFLNFINENLDGLTMDLQAGGLNVSESSSALAVLRTQPPSASPTFIQASDSPSTMMQSGIPSSAPTLATSGSPSTTPKVPSAMPSLGTTSTDMPSSSHAIGVAASLVPVVLLGVFTLMMV